MPRGELWLPEELKVLFKVVQDSCDLDILMSSRHANAVEWEPISREMVRYGFRRTWQQCRAKWKALRRAFHLENEYKLLHGTHSDKRPPSYSIMLKMWQKAGRPVFRDQHMLRTRSNHLHAVSRHREGSDSLCSISQVLNRAQQYPLSIRGGLQHFSSFCSEPVQESYMGLDDIKTVVLDNNIGSSDSNVDASSILGEESALYSTTPEEFGFLHPQVTALEHEVLEDEEDVKPVILHHTPETPRSDTESTPEKCQELQLLEKLVMQQKEIITRLDFLNHNLVQMASWHYQHMAESSADSIHTGSQDSNSVSFPPKLMPFPTATSPESSSYTPYTAQPPTTYISYSQRPPFQIAASYLPTAQPAATYIPSTFYIPACRNSPSTGPASPPQSASHTSEGKHRHRTL